MTGQRPAVVVNIQPVTVRRSGIGEYVLRLVEAIIESELDRIDLHLYNGGEIRRVEDKEAAAAAWQHLPEGGLYALRTQWNLSRALRRGRYELYFSPDVVLPYLPTGIPMVATIHDLIPLAVPQLLTRSRKTRLLFLYRWMCLIASRRCRRLITVSEWSKRDIVRLLGTDPRKVDVIYHGRPPMESKTGTDIVLLGRIREPYFLYVGRRDPYKGLPSLVQAFLTWKERRPGPSTLVLTGATDLRYREADILRERSVHGRDVIDLGYVSDAELTMLYRNALALVFPSLYEGFGLPVLAAMTAGIPVISSNRTSLPEVGGDAVLYYDPEDQDACIAALNTVAENDTLRREFSQKGLLRSELFSWRRTAERTVDTMIRSLHESL